MILLNSLLFKNWLFRNGYNSALFAGGLLVLSMPAYADTLEEALVSAYRSNPTLAAERAGLRATDETVPIARAAGLPQVAVSSSLSNDIYQGNRAVAGNPSRRFDAGLDFSVPLFSGGAVVNSVRAAETRVFAGRADLRSVEAQIFTEVVAVYMDVLRDEAVVALNRRNVEVLEVNLQASQDRFQFGDLTRTDITQSEARLALSQGDLANAEAQLIVSRENYIRMIGDAPEDLMPPPPLPDPPRDVERATDIALQENPNLDSIRFAAAARAFDVRVARASRLPRLSGFVTSDLIGPPALDGGVTPALSGNSRSATAGLTLSVPIFQGGLPAAQVRQAQALHAQALETSTEIERAVVARTRSAFAQWQGAQRVIRSAQVAVEASSLSLEGVRAENSIGTRTILDVLNAEQELLDSQVRLVSARRDEYVATFSLLAAMGRGEAEDLGLEVGALYDPSINAERVRANIWDWAIAPDPIVVATSTSSTPAQTAEIRPPQDNPFVNPE
jgi:outer membrane protein